MKDDGGRNPQSAHVANDGAGEAMEPEMNGRNRNKRDRPERDGLIYVSAARRLPCYVINYFLAALAAFLFSFHTYASYIIGVPMKMEA